MAVQLAAVINNTYLYEIASFTYENVAYDLTVNANGVVTSCGCKDFQYRHRPNGCKHMRAFQAELNAKKAAAAQAEKRAQNERIQAQAQAIVSARFAKLEAQRASARKDGGWSLLR